ncbi:SDR family oxidoreductase [Xiamenia xianingshaonis]|uniref:dTDP-4-dehydrorhamnose reductase n=1 Tax=Xiamenia xianingshaonis TaxID=2682776 RepID=A0A9E6SUZ2_9ACTN|nr:SDR family oxidoreductase [Xiamenia xianingshaonis]NGM18284.1 sugar nucleotide-binding protein [Eggerthellaceae bacterium zg-893]NHM13180.1 sugar nucleotide-binding protein [Xiamenia xianingshaonis]NHM15450.1 sugar nucleotide-binding protein [Xiamenia xianingshaonis]QTU84727.1 SDR family oxidoreductase [Xiamenia xianingshaonis]
MENNQIAWVTGASGFVGRAICEHLEACGYTVVGTGSELSVCEPERLESFAEEVMPGLVVNCAGIRREAAGLSNRVKAYEVNALGARNMALVANTIGATVVQVSSDDVYSSRLDEPVNEFDNPHPDTPYGKSKRAGETMVRNTTPNHLIVRSSWLYNIRGRSMKDVLSAAREGRRIEARTDQFAAPTSLATYVDFIVRAVKHGVNGTFHIATKGRASRYDFAAKMLELTGFDPSDVLVPTSDPKTAENVVLESMMLEMAGIELPTWEEDLRAYLAAEGLLAAGK